LSNPNPIPKVVDVAGVLGGPPYLMAAVGRPLEWDHTVPFVVHHENAFSEQFFVAAAARAHSVNAPRGHGLPRVVGCSCFCPH